MAAPSLGQDASLSFVVRGRGKIVDLRLRIADLGFKKKQKTEIILWERLSAAILRFEPFLRFQRFERFTAY